MRNSFGLIFYLEQADSSYTWNSSMFINAIKLSVNRSKIESRLDTSCSWQGSSYRTIAGAVTHLFGFSIAGVVDVLQY